MNDVVNVIEGAMRADAEAVRVIGQNIANAEVTAYRRQIPLHGGTFAAALEQSGTAGDSSAVAHDFQAGTLRSTGEPLHVALEGAGFFVVSAPDGARLTRRGDLKVSTEGLLVTAAGEPVLGENGAIQLDTSLPSIEADGTIRVGDQVLDRLRIVDVAKLTDLRYQSDGKFVVPEGTSLEPSSATVRQGHLEASNVTPVGEMISLMETVRHFEAGQRMLRGYDDMMQKAISELGKI